MSYDTGDRVDEEVWGMVEDLSQQNKALLEANVRLRKMQDAYNQNAKLNSGELER